jgi:hypothetical protein
MDQIVDYVLTFPIEKNIIFTIFLILINLPLYCVFQASPSLWDFFQLRSTCLVHLKIGTCSLNIMLNNNLKKKENSHYQYYNILSAYEVKDETSTSSTYVSLIFYCMVRSRKI